MPYNVTIETDFQPFPAGAVLPVGTVLPVLIVPAQVNGRAMLNAGAFVTEGTWRMERKAKYQDGNESEFMPVISAEQTGNLVQCFVAKTAARPGITFTYRVRRVR